MTPAVLLLEDENTPPEQLPNDDSFPVILLQDDNSAAEKPLNSDMIPAKSAKLFS